MGFLKMTLWTVCCIGLGVGLGTVEIDGRTPWEYARRAWKHKVNPSRLEQLKDSLGETLDGAKDSLEGARESFSKDAKPRERHSAEDREAINKLIAKRAAAK